MAAHLGEGPWRVQPFGAGKFSETFRADGTDGRYVLRIAPPDDLLQLFYEYRMMRQEPAIHARLLAETSVPVPPIVAHDFSRRRIDRDYLIMPRLPGVQLIDRHMRDALSAKDRRSIACAMGETLAHLHTLTWPFAGEYDFETDTIQPLAADYGEWIVSRIRHYLQLAIPLSDRTTGEDVKWVEGIISAGREALAVPFQPCFVMQDYKEGNAVAECRDGVWHISGVFDLMEPYFGDGEVDLSRSVAVYADKDLELASEFVRAYTRNTSLRRGFAERFPVYMLLDRLIIWQFAQRHGVWWDANLTLREWASRYTSLAVL